MASTTFALDVAEKALLEHGFFALDDSLVGDRIWEMEERGFPYFTEYGLDFCRQFAFDQRIRSILENSFEKCSLGHWLRYEEFPGHVECFRRGGPRAGRRVLVVHLWAKGSQVAYYVGSHLHEMATSRSRRSLYEIPLSELDRVGSKPKHKDFPDGGIVILDARLGFEIKEGYAITFLYATDEVIANWAKIVLPYSKALVEKVSDMEKESTRIGLNFAFEVSPGGKAT
ncbi:hypothetical protein MYCTH_2056329 [Thermothelomyces thermophilus ATCC 42464]|uniref:Uncharacterized protein n=1 Tax=Thermothelomyces thermophilus (strain ATCC 42464 / BCRC 31852 / DSM 1799) TaxID=573729 RepID=G2Q8X4_THET4|nr:uncharacterized protein MYCTH_2056329 [Thermothelomyces thermophilus ATCC 42464]AEO57119.1 hypothetical protein MYCTH_2056329 [Thermothelomyces thermophilus ATCC 42464]